MLIAAGEKAFHFQIQIYPLGWKDMRESWIKQLNQKHLRTCVPFPLMEILNFMKLLLYIKFYLLPLITSKSNCKNFIFAEFILISELQGGEIESYFRKQAKLLHPDKNGHIKAKEAFQKFSQTYHSLNTFKI
jgi:hypothetical protein